MVAGEVNYDFTTTEAVCTEGAIRAHTFTNFILLTAVNILITILTVARDSPTIVDANAKSYTATITGLRTFWGSNGGCKEVSVVLLRAVSYPALSL